MPPRWPRRPDPKDPAYRRLADRMNLAVHVALFAAVNSGLWFVHELTGAWPRLPWVTGLWGLGLLSHAWYVLRVARYEV
ncbi:MAG: 2TM domain-containing protein [Gloeomargarita sp. SKYBB_i_bin120]|nr:2TM domain-containing protein [Gloeomargarita sp. SKYG98]MCS7293152.1 2TM domain-containing protein [Gloeomargarita sp. SKYB120]MDW8178717.1 2TM domain-containing protein [Gloeomargarita sp. SKYBB_i_bin120]